MGGSFYFPEQRCSMDRTERVELANICLVYHQDEILMQNRTKDDWRGFTLPGGHVEPGESVVESVVREVKEETGLDIQNPVLCGVKQFPIENGRYIIFLFKTNEFSGKLVSSEEGEMRWVKRSEVAQLDTVPDFDKLLNVMESDKLWEFAYRIEEENWIPELH